MNHFPPLDPVALSEAMGTVKNILGFDFGVQCYGACRFFSQLIGLKKHKMATCRVVSKMNYCLQVEKVGSDAAGAGDESARDYDALREMLLNSPSQGMRREIRPPALQMPFA